MQWLSESQISHLTNRYNDSTNTGAGRWSFHSTRDFSNTPVLTQDDIYENPEPINTSDEDEDTYQDAHSTQSGKTLSTEVRFFPI